MKAASANGNKRPRAILFDWDNTLVDTWPVIHQTLNVTLEEFGLVPWTLAESRQRVRRSMRDSFPLLFGDRWEEAGDFFYRCFADIHLDRLRPLPGAEEMLAVLKHHEIYLGIVSNKHGKYLRREVTHLGWDSYFGATVGAHDAPRDKPATDAVDLALAGSPVPSGQSVWFVGDTEIDMECAINAGCIPVLVHKTPAESKAFQAFPPALHVINCLALSNAVQGL